MLFYLDNWMSADPNGPHPVAGQRAFGPAVQRPGRARFQPLPRARQQKPPQRANAPKGLNENYGRELHELFTIGRGLEGSLPPVTDIGDYFLYKEQDVQAAAKILSGWDISSDS